MGSTPTPLTDFMGLWSNATTPAGSTALPGGISVDVEYLHGHKLFVIPQFLTPEECDTFIERSERLGYADAPINTSFGPLLRKDVRDNQRILVDDPELAAAWWERAKGLLVDEWFGWKAVGLNERFRFYR